MGSFGNVPKNQTHNQNCPKFVLCLLSSVLPEKILHLVPYEGQHPLKGLGHAAVHAGCEPLGNGAEDCAFIIINNHFQVFVLNLQVGRHTVEIGADRVVAHFPEVPLEYIPVNGVIYVEHGLPVVGDGLCNGVETLLKGVQGRVGGCYLIRCLLYKLLQKIRYIVVMIVEGIAVNAAAVHYVLYRDFVVRPIVEQGNKGLFYGFFG